MTERGWKIAQPSHRRLWQLRDGDHVLAVLRIPLFRRGGRAEAGGRHLVIERHGRLRADYVLRDEATGEQLARLRPDGRRRILELGDTTAEWKRLGRKEGHGFVGQLGEPLLRGKVSSGITRTQGEVHVAHDVPEDRAVVMALLASYLLIRKAEEDAAAASSSVAATSS